MKNNLYLINMYKKEIKFVNQTLFFYNIDEFKKINKMWINKNKKN